jgi:hypothetical protein
MERKQWRDEGKGGQGLEDRGEERMKESGG